jgi:hypothetical protein
MPPRFRPSGSIPSLAALLLLALGAAAPLQAGSISGTVRSATGSVLQGMVVAAYDAGGSVAGSATTDANGHYAMSLSAGQYRLLAYDGNGVWATEFCAGAESFETSPPQNVGVSGSSTIDFQLQRGGTVGGTVGVAAAPRSGLTVAAYNLSGTRRGFVTTAGQGTYSILLPPGQFKLAAYDDAGLLTPLFYPGTTSFADAAVITVSSGSGLGADFNLDFAAHLTGAVLDRVQNPLPAMTVFAFTPQGASVASAATGSSGAFSLTVPAGSYRLVAADPQAVFASAFAGDAASFGKSSVIAVNAGQTRADLTMIMDRGGQLRGRVTDGNGTPINGIHVAAYNDDGSSRAEQTTDNTGAYLLVLPPGRFRLAAFDNKLLFATEFYPQRIDFSSATPLSIAAGQVIPALDFALSRAGRVGGFVTDAATGAPLANITVAAYDAGIHLIASAVSGAAGQYTVGVPQGTYRVAAWDAGHFYASSFDGGAATFEATPPRTIAADTTQSANFAMSRGLPIAGTVVSSQQAPIEGVVIDALDLQGNHVASGISGGDGSFIITVLPNTYKLFARDPEKRYRSTYYGGTGSLTSATAVIVSGTPSAPVSIVLAPAQKPRAVTH